MTTYVADHRGLLVGRVLAVFLALHGVAHFVGVSGSIGAITDHDPVDLLFGAASVSNDLALGGFALAWGILGAGFLVVAVLVWRQADLARPALVGVVVASVCVGVFFLWAGVVGVVINAVLLVVAVVAPEPFGLPPRRS